jgi:malonyl-CoA/methylmalonyl-CoA synthetase
VALLDRFARARGTAVIDDRGEHDFDALRARAASVAAFLGDRRGRRVAILASPGAEFVSTFFGVVSSGACALVLSPLHPAAETRFFCDDADVDLVLVTADQRLRAGAAAREVVDVATVAARPAPDVAIDPEDPALMLYTSGTTGKPKGAVLSHRSLSTQQELLAEAWGLSSSDVLLHLLPLHHMHGLCISLLSCLGAGAAVRMLPGFDAARAWREMARCTVVMAVPTIYKKLFDALDGSAERDEWMQNASKLRLATSGSAALPVTLAERWRAASGRIPLERFGMTEIGVGLSNPLDGERRAGTVGLPLRTVETRIDEASGSGGGELLVRGPSLFSGYFRREEATARAFVDGSAEGGTPPRLQDGWFRTGDTVTRDERGYFRVLGRTSVDILKSGGYKLSALEIEEALREHEAVSEVAVVGVPDETWGDRVVACVVPRAGAVLEPDALRAFAKQRLASYKCPKQVVILAELPRNAMGKVQKPALVAKLSGRA